MPRSPRPCRRAPASRRAGSPSRRGARRTPSRARRPGSVAQRHQHHRDRDDDRHHVARPAHSSSRSRNSSLGGDVARRDRHDGQHERRVQLAHERVRPRGALVEPDRRRRAERRQDHAVERVDDHVGDADRRQYPRDAQQVVHRVARRRRERRKRSPARARPGSPLRSRPDQDRQRAAERDHGPQRRVERDERDHPAQRTCTVAMTSATRRRGSAASRAGCPRRPSPATRARSRRRARRTRSRACVSSAGMSSTSASTGRAARSPARDQARPRVQRERRRDPRSRRPSAAAARDRAHRRARDAALDDQHVEAIEIIRPYRPNSRRLSVRAEHGDDDRASPARRTICAACCASMPRSRCGARARSGMAVGWPVIGAVPRITAPRRLAQASLRRCA